MNQMNIATTDTPYDWAAHTEPAKARSTKVGAVVLTVAATVGITGVLGLGVLVALSSSPKSAAAKPAAAAPVPAAPAQAESNVVDITSAAEWARYTTGSRGDWCVEQARPMLGDAVRLPGGTPAVITGFNTIYAQGVAGMCAANVETAYGQVAAKYGEGSLVGFSFTPGSPPTPAP